MKKVKKNVSKVKMLLGGGSLLQKTFFEHILPLPPRNQIPSFILFHFLQMEQHITRKSLFKVLTFLLDSTFEKFHFSRKIELFLKFSFVMLPLLLH